MAKNKKKTTQVGVGGGGGQEPPPSRRRWRLAPLLAAVLALLLATALGSPTLRLRKLSTSANSCKCGDNATKYSGTVEDCCCDYQTVNQLNDNVLHPILHQLVQTPFFRYFKVKLWCDCPFWPDDGMCSLRDCSVCECPDNEFPESFKNPSTTRSAEDITCQEGKPQAAVDRTLDNNAFSGWMEVDNPWTYDDETNTDDMTYVNLQLNPERYTGYSGPSTWQIWNAIYRENCPKYPSEKLCSEQKVLYKLISGLHSLISVHIASDYLIGDATQLVGFISSGPVLLVRKKISLLRSV